MVTHLETAHKHLVIKIGSSLLIGEDGALRRDWLGTVVADIAALQKSGHGVIIVSSGSIALGTAKLGQDHGGKTTLADAQAAASVGQIALAGLWSDLLAEQDIIAAQMLLTLDDMEVRKRYLNATATMRRLLQKGAIPVINENDSVATTEIRFGDNDRLAARVAHAIEADTIILLSDVDGLYDKNPAEHDDARRIPSVDEIDDDILAMASAASSSGLGSGGMKSKLEAAQIANLAGASLIITSGEYDHPIRRWQNENTGTIFHAKRRENALKSWLGGRISVNGRLVIDDGAAKALKEGNSLLPVGVNVVEGNFDRGDLIEIYDGAGALMGKGLIEYDAAESQLIIGQHKDDIAGILGYVPRRAMIHRDQMVLV